MNRQPIYTDPEVIVQNARAIVGDSPVYPMVELITNSDDSYDRLENRKITTSGLIHLEIVRKWRGSIIKIVDQAEGFDKTQMDIKVGRYGGNRSSQSEIQSRGYFMRGLKEAMVGVGYGIIKSVKDGSFYECDVDEDAYYASKEPQKCNSKIKGELGISENGTEVLLKVTRDGIIIPQFEKLKEQLQKYFSLRKILQNQDRIIQLVERYEKGGKKREPVLITYKEPVGEKIVDGPIYINYDGKKIDARLIVKKSEIPLSGKDEAGPYRENGLLISDGKAIHDITLFKYDNNPDAERIFGEVECKYIYELMRKKEQVVSAKRDELNSRHPFTRALRESVEKALEPIIKEEKTKREQEKKDVETRETKERFKKLLKDLNNIVEVELGKKGSEGDVIGGDENVQLPENGFAFIPPATTVISGKTKTITLRALVPHTIPLNQEVLIESDSEEVIILTPVIKFQNNSVTNDTIGSQSIKVEGRQVGALAIITAKFGELKAECLIQVRSKPKEIEEPPPHEKKFGLFKDISYRVDADPRYRATFDKSTGLIIIATRAPSVEIYLGINAENQNEKYARVLVAELVTDVVCRELARRKIELGRTTYPQSNLPEAINFERAQLINSYAERIHRRLAG